MILELLHNITLLISLSVFYGLLIRYQLPRREIYFKICGGILFGIITLVGMKMPFVQQNGVFFDGRSIIISLAGLFGGGITVAIASLIAMSYRLLIGGIGVYAGVATILSSALIGLWFRYLSNNEPEALAPFLLFVMGIVTLLGMFFCQYIFLPGIMGKEIIRQIGLSVTLIFPFASLIIGFFLGNEQRRIKAENKILESEKKFREIFNSTGEAIFIHDAETGTIIDMNDRALKMYEYEKKSDLTGKDVICLSVGDPVLLRRRMRRFMYRTMEIGPQSFDWRAQRKNGDLFWVELSLKKSYIDNQNCIIAVARDITARKLVIEQLKKKKKEYKELNMELSDSLLKIKRINSELEEAKERAEKSDQLKSAFLANISHEIRTPMNGILGFVDLLKDSGLNKDIQQEYISVVEESGNRLLSIINDLIDISKIEVGEMKMFMSQVDINQLLDSLAVFFKPEADKNGLLLACNKELAAEKSVITTDETKLFQILSNLIKNALKFTPRGMVEFGYFVVGTDLEFYVKDTGKGIPIEIQDTIFERFRQADQNFGDGVGLGLYISKVYVEMLGGKIWLKSKVNQGTTFYFTLPCDRNGGI